MNDYSTLVMLSLSKHDLLNQKITLRQAQGDFSVFR